MALDSKMLSLRRGFGRGADRPGELVLTLRVGETGELSFLLTADFADQLAKSLSRKS